MSRARTPLPWLLLAALWLLGSGCRTIEPEGPRRADYDDLAHPAAAFAFFRDSVLARAHRQAWETLSPRMRAEISYPTFLHHVQSEAARPLIRRLRSARFLEHTPLNPQGSRTRVTIESEGQRLTFPMVLTAGGWRIDEQL